MRKNPEGKNLDTLRIRYMYAANENTDIKKFITIIIYLTIIVHLPLLNQKDEISHYFFQKLDWLEPY